MGICGSVQCMATGTEVRQHYGTTVSKYKTGVYFTWRQIYRCVRQGTGRLKGYDKIYPDKICKICTKWTSCSCVLVIKSYPKTTVILGHYSNQHDHPIHMDNLQYVQISDSAKTTIRDLLEMGFEHSEIVHNFKF